jgi:type III pantothenate kinase
MNLLVDIGNARIKWALQEDGTLQTGTPLLRLDKAFKDLARPAWKELETPQRVIVANVAGADYEKAVTTWVKRRWKVTPEFLRADKEFDGVSNAYKEPARLGADRWANLLAAHAQFRAPVVIVDCGTAITVDAMTLDGRHLGGLIAPGIDLMTASLTNRAPGIEIRSSDDQDIALLGSSTEVGVTGGVMYAAVSLVDRVLMDLKSELGKTTQQIITGGDAERIGPLLSSQPHYEPDFVLKGLAAFARAGETAAASIEPQPVASRAAACDT